MLSNLTIIQSFNSWIELKNTKPLEYYTHTFFKIKILTNQELEIRRLAAFRNVSDYFFLVVE